MPSQEDQKNSGLAAGHALGAGAAPTRSESLGEADARAMEAGLARGAAREFGESLPIALRAAGADGALAGALVARLELDWLWIDSLWVSEASRRQGVGSGLLREAEGWAHRRGAVGMALSVHDFHDRSFFAGRGFQVFGALGDNPRGRLRHFMRRHLV